MASQRSGSLNIGFVLLKLDDAYAFQRDCSQESINCLFLLPEVMCVSGAGYPHTGGAWESSGGRCQGLRAVSCHQHTTTSSAHNSYLLPYRLRRSCALFHAKRCTEARKVAVAPVTQPVTNTMNALSPVPTQPSVINCQRQMFCHDSSAAC